MRRDRVVPGPRVLACLATVALAAGCGGDPEPLVVRADPGVFEPADWERAFDPSEFGSYRAGRVQLLQPGGQASDPRSAAGEAAVRPAVGAEIQLFAATPLHGLPLSPVATTVTDEEGRFRVGPGPSTGWVVRARAEGYADAYGGDAPLIPGVMTWQDGHLEIGLVPSVELAGSLTERDGAALAGEPLLIEALAFFGEVVTDEDGRFATRVPMGAAIVHGGSARSVGRLAHVQTPNTALQLVVPRYEPLRGMVVDARSERPVAGAVVVHVQKPKYRTVTDARGHFVLEAPRDGRIAAFAEGLGWRSARIPVAGDVDLRLRAARRVSGRVVDASGAPVANARIFATAPGTDNSFERVIGPLTDADGRFELSWIPERWIDAESDPVIVGSRRGHGHSAGVSVPTDLEGVELVLPGERSVQGRVVRASGDPVAHVPVDVMWRPKGLVAHTALTLGVPTRRAAVTGADGAFRVGGISAGAGGQATFQIEGTDYVREFGPEGEVELDVQLAPGRPIAGHVVDVSGKRVVRPGSVIVRSHGEAGFDLVERTTELQADGTFHITELPPGRYIVTALIRGYEVLSGSVDAGDENVVLRAEQPASLLVDVVFPPGVTPVPSMVLLRALDDPAAEVRREDATAEGETLRAEFRVVRMGRYELTARAGVYGGRIPELQVADGSRPPVRVAMQEQSVLHAVVLSASGDPLSGRVVRARPLSGGVPQNFVSDENGKVRMIGLEEGAWRARLVQRGAPSVEVRFTTPADADDVLELRVPAHGTVHIQFPGPPGEDVIVGLEHADGSACYAWAEGDNAQNARFRLPEDGDALRLEGVPAGTVTVIAQRSGSSERRREAEVRDGETVRVAFD